MVVTRTTRAAQLVNATIDAIDTDDVVWVGRRQSFATMRAAAFQLVERRPGLGYLVCRADGESDIVWTAHPESFTGAAFQTTARSERYKLREIDGELVAYPAEDPAA